MTLCNAKLHLLWFVAIALAIFLKNTNALVCQEAVE